MSLHSLGRKCPPTCRVKPPRPRKLLSKRRLDWWDLFFSNLAKASFEIINKFSSHPGELEYHVPRQVLDRGDGDATMYHPVAAGPRADRIRSGKTDENKRLIYLIAGRHARAWDAFDSSYQSK